MRYFPIACAAFILTSLGVNAQQAPAPVVPPSPPKISMPSASETPNVSGRASVDNVMTLGRPDPEPLTSVPASHLQVPPGEGVQVSVTPMAPLNLRGLVRVVDGNTLSLRGQTIHLSGIDVPEKGQTCYDLVGVAWDCHGRSISKLSVLTGGKIVHCREVNLSTGTGKCFVEGQDLSLLMVQAGMAVAGEGDVSYGGAEAQARMERKGVWSGRFDMPWVFRTR